MKKHSIKKRSLTFLVVLAMIFSLFSGTDSVVPALADSPLGAPANVSWKTGALATASWEAVDGADYYVVTVGVSYNGQAQGTVETGSTSTETDVQQQIRGLAPQGVDSVKAWFCVKAQNRDSGAESDYSANSSEITYNLSALESLPTPQNVTLSDDGIVTFDIVEGAHHYFIAHSVENSGAWVGGETTQPGVVSGSSISFDISENIKGYYIERGFVGETVRFVAMVKAVSADGKWSDDSEPSNAINYCLTSSVATPTFVSFSKKDHNYSYTFCIDQSVDYYEFELYLKRFTTREERYEVNENTVKPSMDWVRVPASSNDISNLGDGLYEINLLDVLRYYFYKCSEQATDCSADIGIRVRGIRGTDIGAYSAGYIVENFLEPPVMDLIQNPILTEESGNVLLSFNSIDGAAGYKVRYRVETIEGEEEFPISKCVVSEGMCTIDLTELKRNNVHSLSNEGKLTFFSVRVKPYGNIDNYEIGAYSEKSNSIRHYPYGALVNGLTLAPTNPIVAVGNKLYLGKTVSPTNGYYENIEWNSDNNSVLTVNGEGCIFGISEGEATVTALVDKSVKTTVKANVYEVHSNIEDQTEAETVEDQTGDIIDDIGNNTDPDLSQTDISEEDLDEIRDDIHAGVENGDTFHTDIRAIQQYFESYKQNWGQIQKAAKELNGQFAGAYNIEVEMYHKSQSGEEYHIGNIIELNDEVTFTFDLPTGMKEKQNGTAKKYVLVRVHKNQNGTEEYETIDYTVNSDGTFTAKSDKYSDFIWLEVSESTDGQTPSGGGSGTTTPGGGSSGGSSGGGVGGGASGGGGISGGSSGGSGGGGISGGSSTEGSAKPDETGSDSDKKDVSNNTEDANSKDSEKEQDPAVSTSTSEDKNGTVTVKSVTRNEDSTVEETKKTYKPDKDGNVKTTISKKENGADGTKTVQKETTVVDKKGNVSTVSDTTRTEADGTKTKTTITAELNSKGKGTISAVVKVGKKTVESEEYSISSKGNAKITNLSVKGKAVSIPKEIEVSGTVMPVTSIAKNAMKGNKKIESVSIGDNITSIGAGAFKGNEKLNSVELTASITKIYKNAFAGIAENAVFKIKGTQDDFDRIVALLKESGISDTVTFELLE